MTRNLDKWLSSQVTNIIHVLFRSPFIPIDHVMFLLWQAQLIIAGKSQETRQVVGVLMGKGRLYT